VGRRKPFPPLGLRGLVQRETWIDRYGPLVADQIDADRRYSLVKVGALEFAYSTYEGYVRALREAWDAGFVPEPLGSAEGSRVLEAAPNLVAVDAELSDLQTSDSSRAS
jgi:hypothetical protein